MAYSLFALDYFSGSTGLTHHRHIGDVPTVKKKITGVPLGGVTVSVTVFPDAGVPPTSTRA
jgi:hypothetical protein